MSFARLIRILRSASFRLPLIYAVLFVLSAGALFVTVYWTATAAMAAASVAVAAAVAAAATAAVAAVAVAAAVVVGNRAGSSRVVLNLTGAPGPGRLRLFVCTPLL
jgi:hypothetical protein